MNGSNLMRCGTTMSQSLQVATPVTGGVIFGVHLATGVSLCAVCFLIDHGVALQELIRCKLHRAQCFV